MDDVHMADDSSPSGSAPSQRFNIADMLGEAESRSTFESMSGVLMASATADAATIGSSLSGGSTYCEENEDLIIQRLQTLYPYLDHKKDPIPRFWNSNNKTSTSLSISSDFLRIQYKVHLGKSGRNEKEPIFVRADRPIPNMSIVYYFEIYIVNKDSNGDIAIGVSDKNAFATRVQGWDENWYAYHGNDGNFTSQGNPRQTFGPKYAVGDVVGCGLNFVTRELFFTRNGTFLGIATKDIKMADQFFPTVGLQTSNVTIDTNFGQKAFKFDIQNYKEDTQAFVYKTIRNIPLPPEKALWMNRTVSGWLEHEGYSRALRAFNAATRASECSTLLKVEESDGQPSPPSVDGGSGASGSVTRRSVVKHANEASANEEMENRRAVTRLVYSGRTAEAIREVERLYPTLLTSNKELALLLKIQHYIEMIADVSKENVANKQNNNSASSMNVSSSVWNDFYGLNASTSAPVSYGAQSLLKRSTAPYHVENGRNSLKRRSNEEEIRQSPRRVPARAINNTSASLNAFAAAAASSANAQSFSMAENGEEPMDTGHIAGAIDTASGNNAATNGNFLPTSSTNGISAPAIAGTPPTSTTIIEEEELDELNDARDALLLEDGKTSDGDMSGYENGFAENYQHLQKYMPIIEYGHSISQFSQQLPSTTSSKLLLKRMNDAFSLIGYVDPTQSSSQYLLSQWERNFVAKALNRALLDMMGKERMSTLDRYIYKVREDRKKSVVIATAAFFANVDELLFSRHPVYQPSGVRSGDAASPSATGRASGSQADAPQNGGAAPARNGTFAANAVDDENSNGSSSMGGASFDAPKD